MIIDQDEINALLNQAEEIADEPELEAAESQEEAAAPVSLAPLRQLRHTTPEIARLLRIRVPVIVQLAHCSMQVAEIREIAIGKIIQFEQHIDNKLTLLVNNLPIGEGTAVKVGESFGMRVSAIRDQKQRIRSLGG